MNPPAKPAVSPVFRLQSVYDAGMKLRVGTSGYSYKEWKGSFYRR